MRVLIVCNNAYMRGNGICTAVLSLVRRLKQRGVEARIMACENPNSTGPQPEYPLRHCKIPFFESMIYSSGFRFATFDKQTAIRAIRWAEVVHLCEGFPMEAKVARLARKMGKPCVATFHLFSENITANLGFRKAKLLNCMLTRWWRKSVYDLCSHVHCPTQTVKEYLLSNGFKSQMRIITNGMDIPERQSLTEQWSTEPIVILSVGRLAYEKSQDTLLNAMRYSRYADKIQLHFAGNGPCSNKYKHMAERLVKEGVLHYAPKFAFYDTAQLKELIRSAYLYVHTAWVEVEGLSCAEAILEGVVPIIAQGQLSATSQFALDSRSTFPVFDSKALARRIDWWIEHPVQRMEMGKKYAESINSYNADDATWNMIQMYRESIAMV